MKYEYSILARLDCVAITKVSWYGIHLNLSPNIGFEIKSKAII